MTVNVMFVSPEVGGGRMFAISASRPCRIPAFTTRRRSSSQMSSARISAIASQSRAAKCARRRSSTRVAAFSSRGAVRVQFVESRERGVEVCLVEDFAAVDQVAFDRRRCRSSATRRRSPLARSHCSTVGDDRSEVAQPMHSLDVDADVRSEVPRGTK